MSHNSQSLSKLPQGTKLSRPSTSVALKSTKDVCKSQESCPRSPAYVRSSLVATYRYETQQESNGDAIDSIGLSELYIRAQISDSYATTDTSNQSTTVSHHRSAQNAPNRHAGRYGTAAVTVICLLAVPTHWMHELLTERFNVVKAHHVKMELAVTRTANGKLRLRVQCSAC
jgi:hypothetical protein